jgi:hypothetical protein
MNILWSLSTTGQPLVLCPFECNEIVVRGLAGLWAAGHDLKLVLAGPKRTHAGDRARPVDNILTYRQITIP